MAVSKATAVSTLLLLVSAALFTSTLSQGVVVEVLNSTAVAVDWSQFLAGTDRTNTLFLIVRQRGLRPPHSTSIKKLLIYNSQVTMTTVSGLQSGQSYQVEVWGVVAVVSRRGGASHIQEDQSTVNITMATDKPSGVVQGIRVQTDSRTIHLTWEFSSYELQNGPITTYLVQLQRMVSSSRYDNTQSHVVRVTDATYPDESTHALTLTNETAGIGVGGRYRVRIAAQNVNGTGPFTEWIAMETKFEVPLPPLLVVLSRVNSSLLVAWLPAVQSPGNAVTMYRVRYAHVVSNEVQLEGEESVPAGDPAPLSVLLRWAVGVVQVAVEAVNQAGSSPPALSALLLQENGTELYPAAPGNTGGVDETETTPTKQPINNNNNNNNNTSTTAGLGSAGGMVVGVAAGSALAGLIVGVVALVTLEVIVYLAIRKSKKGNPERHSTRPRSIGNHSNTINDDDMKPNDYETLRHVAPSNTNPIYSSIPRTYDVPSSSDTKTKPKFEVTVYEVPPVARESIAMDTHSFPRIYDSADSDTLEPVATTTHSASQDDYDSAYCEMRPVSLLSNNTLQAAQASEYLEPASLTSADVQSEI